MVHAIEDVKRRMVIRHSNKEINKPYVKCWKCGYKWTPNPSKWKGRKLKENLITINGHYAKVLFCQNCLARSYLGIKEIEKLLRWYNRANSA